MIFDPITWKVRFAFTGKLEKMEEKNDGIFASLSYATCIHKTKTWSDLTLKSGKILPTQRAMAKWTAPLRAAKCPFWTKKTSESSEKKSPSTSFMYFLVMKNWDLKKWCKKRCYIDLKHIAFLDPPKPLKMHACGQLFSHGSEWSPISKGSLNGVLISLISETVSAGHQTHH